MKENIHIFIKKVTTSEKEEVMMDAIHKTITMACLEYDMTPVQVVGCLDIIKGEYKQQYWDTKNG